MGAFLVPIFVIIVVNVVFFICVIVVVTRHAWKKSDHMKQSITNKEILRMFGLAGVLLLFGLTWAFFLFTLFVPGLRETFQILFTVFSSLQGIFIFVINTFTEGFNYWKTLLSMICKKCKSVKLAQPVSTPETKSSTIPNSLPRQVRNASESSHDKKTTEMNNEKLQLKELQFTNGLDSPNKPVCDNTPSSMNEIDKSNCALQNQLQNDQQSSNESEQEDIEGESEEQTNTKPLSVLVNRYSIKRHKRQHVEVKIDFYDEERSSTPVMRMVNLDAYSAK